MFVILRFEVFVMGYPLSMGFISMRFHRKYVACYLFRRVCFAIIWFIKEER